MMCINNPAETRPALQPKAESKSWAKEEAMVTVWGEMLFRPFFEESRNTISAHTKGIDNTYVISTNGWLMCS